MLIHTPLQAPPEEAFGLVVLWHQHGFASSFLARMPFAGVFLQNYNQELPHCVRFLLTREHSKDDLAV